MQVNVENGTERSLLQIVIITTNIMLFWMYLLVHIPLPPQDNADLHTCLLDEEVSRSTGKEEEGQIHHSTL